MNQRTNFGGIPHGEQTPMLARAVRWGDLLFLSGRVALSPDTGAPVSSEFDEQARFVLDDVLDVLDEAGSGPEHALRVMCYLADRTHFAAWNRIYAEYFPSPRPARTTLVAGFVLPGLLLEVEVTAGVPLP